MHPKRVDLAEPVVSCLAQTPPGSKAHPSCKLPTHCQQGRRISWCGNPSPSLLPMGSVTNLRADPMSKAETPVLHVATAQPSGPAAQDTRRGPSAERVAGPAGSQHRARTAVDAPPSKLQDPRVSLPTRLWTRVPRVPLTASSGGAHLAHALQPRVRHFERKPRRHASVSVLGLVHGHQACPRVAGTEQSCRPRGPAPSPASALSPAALGS